MYIRYLLLPARGVPLILIGCFALALTTVAWAGLLGLPLALILVSWISKYAFVLFDTARRGFDEPPVLSLDMVNPANEQRPLGQLVIIGVFYGVTEFLARFLGDTLATVLRAAGLLILPASVAVLGSTRNLVDAVNPVLLARFIQRVGLDYLGLLAVIALYALFIVYLPWRLLWLPLNFALLQFATLAMFSVMGGILYERRHELGLEPWRSPEKAQALQARQWERARDREAEEIYVHYRSGYRADAWKTLQAVLEKAARSLDVYQALYRRIARWPDPRLADRLAREMLPRLLAEKHPSEALLVVRERLQADASFRPESGAETLRLARLARSGGDPATARQLLEEFARHFPGDAAAIHHAAQLARELQR